MSGWSFVKPEWKGNALGAVSHRATDDHRQGRLCHRTDAGEYSPCNVG